jgi:hypothetical protein
MGSPSGRSSTGRSCEPARTWIAASTILLKAKHGGYADLVCFESKEDADRVAQAEATSEHCLALFQLLQPPDPSAADMGVLSFEHLRTHE